MRSDCEDCEEEDYEDYEEEDYEDCEDCEEDREDGEDKEDGECEEYGEYEEDGEIPLEQYGDLQVKFEEIMASDHIKHMAQERSFKRFSPAPDFITPGPPPAPVIILGSGLSALTLALSLHKKKIPFKIYTKDRPPQEVPNQHDYSILLGATTIKQLWKLLDKSKDDFRSVLMVPNTTPFPSEGQINFTARVHRGRLEDHLRRDFVEKIEWGCEIEAGKMGSPPLVFPSHVKRVDGDIIFDCMGAHSPIKCSQLYDEIYPVAVFRGAAQVSKSIWDQKFQSWFQGDKTQIQETFDGTILDLIIDDINPANGEVRLNYFFSRTLWKDPTGQLCDKDKLWAPTSPLLFKDFFNEIKRLRLKHELPAPYDEIFDPKEMEQDVIENCLQTRKLANQVELINLWLGEKIVKLGDAVLSMPMVENTGARLAIHDGVKAARELELRGGAMFHRWLIVGWKRKVWHFQTSKQAMVRRYLKK
ncbi:hypothetical protein NHQ30_010723 [Ciborinia camelliae]|nr:hypothetical protein NHQ30_010723 [Ciborinia camelliae]